MAASSLWQNFLEETDTKEHTSEYEKLQQQLIALWKKRNVHSDVDEFKQLEARIFRIGNKHQHVCTQYCTNHPSWANETNFVGAILDVFVNDKRKEWHICNGVQCGAKHVVSDGMSTCTISGLQFAQEKWINSFKLNHEYHRTSSSTVRIETAMLKDTAKNLIKKLLFSDIRVKAERKKIFDIKKEIRKMWIKEKRERQRKKQPIDAIQLITKSFYVKQKRHPKTYKIPEQATQEMIYEFYSQKICACVGKLKTLTGFQTESIGAPQITALLYLMRKGLVYNDISIIPKDYYLETSLPTANALDLYKVSKTHFTAAKTRICAAMRDSIISGVNPHHLIVSSLQQQ